jgi:hypothetical protein
MRKYTARPGFFRFLASHHFFSGLRSLNFLSSQLRKVQRMDYKPEFGNHVKSRECMTNLCAQAREAFLPHMLPGLSRGSFQSRQQAQVIA